MLNTQHFCSKQKLGNVLINNILKNNVTSFQPSSSYLSTLSKQDKFKLQNLKLSTIPLQSQESPVQNYLIHKNSIQNGLTRESIISNHIQKNNFSFKSFFSHKWEMDYDASVNHWLEKDKTSVRMEEAPLKEKIENYIKSQNTCALATGSSDSLRNTPIEYNYVDGCFYFFSEGGLKFKGLKENNNVAIAICDPSAGFTNIKSVQVEGIAIMIEPFSDEYLKIMEYKKIPVERMKKLSPPMNLIKVVIKSVDYYESNLKKEGFSSRQHLDMKGVENKVQSAHKWDMDYDAAINYWMKKDKTMKRVEDAILKEKIENYVKSRKICSLATGSAKWIRNTPMEYDYIDGYFYFFSEGGLKFKGLKENKNVSIAICEPYSGFKSIKSIQVNGIASMIEPFSDEYLKIVEYKKVPLEMIKKLSPPMNLIKVAVKNFDYLDSDFNKEGFGYRQQMKGWTKN